MSRLARPGHRTDVERATSNRSQLIAAVMGGPDVLAVVDADGTVRSGGGQRAGWPSIVPGANLLAAVHPDDSGQVAAFLATVAGADPSEGTRGPVGWRLAGHPARHVEATATNRLADPSVRGIVVSLRDVEDRARAEDQLRRQAFHDPLTDLPNRHRFYDLVESALAVDGRTIGLLYLDLDGFKAVNDRLGHHLGDAVLVEVAARLSATLRAGDTAARLGGDEFGILLEGVSGPNDAVQAALRLLSVLDEPLAIVDPPVALQPSVGVAVEPARSAGTDEVLRRADVALGEAKRSATHRWALYDPTTDHPSGVRKRRAGKWFARTREQRDEVADILDRSDALVAAYQPIMDLRTGLVAGYEALARFPRHGHHNPAEWFARAHRCGLGFELEARAVSAALTGTVRPQRTFLSVNLSPSAFASDAVQAVLPERLDGLVVEITENEHVSDDRGFSRARELLRSRGGRLAVDDAGAGYAGLRQLMRLQPDVLKLDRAMVDGVAGDPAKAALIEAMVGYADRIGAQVCAEGIEDLADLEALAELDVTFGQGWALARPAASWTGVAPEAAAMCRASYSASLGVAGSDEAFAMSRDRRLQWLIWRLSEATSYGQLAGAVEAIARDLHADDITVSVVDERREDLVFVGPDGLRHQEQRYALADYPTTAWILREQRAVQVLASDPAADPTEIAVLEEQGMRSVLMVPVVCGGRSIGLLETYSHAERPWSRLEMGRARLVAFQVGAALERLAHITA